MVKKYFMISEFADLAGISRKNLIFYDKIGLLKPEIVTENKYRLYSYKQIDTASVIWALRQIGVSLDEIKDYLDKRSPDNFIELFSTQRDIITQRIEELETIRDMMDFRIAAARRSKDVDADEIVLSHLPEQPLFMGPTIPEGGDNTEWWYYLADFYEYCAQNGIEYGLPVGAVISNAELLKRNWNNPSNYYYRIVEDGHVEPNFTRPEGDYITGWEYADYGMTDGVYKRLLEYAERHKLKITGDSYEEFLLDEIAAPDPHKYLMEITVQVSK